MLKRMFLKMRFLSGPRDEMGLQAAVFREATGILRPI